MDQFRIDPGKLPKQIEIDIPQKIVERLEQIAAESDRSLNELILEIIDRELGEY